MSYNYQVVFVRESGQRKLLNALLALLTGILALLYPNFLYYIFGGYMIALGLLLLYFQISSFLTAIAFLGGILVFLFPESIPLTAGIFLAILGFTLLFSFGFTVLGILTLIISAVIFANPGSIAYMIAVFLLLYSLTYIIKLIQESRDEPGIDKIE